MYRKIITLCSLLVLLPTSAAMAQDGRISTLPNAYISAFIDRHSLGLNDTTVQLKPVVGSAALGYWVREGIGLELEAGVGLDDDSVGDLDVKHSSKLAVSLRLESPPIDRVAAYILVGYVRTDYDAKANGLSSSVSLPGGRMAVGLTYIMAPQLLMDASFTHHDYDQEVRINSFRLGVRFNLGSN